MKLELWHNIMWSRYKAVVFSALGDIADAKGLQLQVYQIAETERDRVCLSPVDLRWHRYPMIRLFRGSYSDISKFRLVWELGRHAATTNADLVVVAGFDKLEYWVQGAVLAIRRRRRAVICDSTLFDNPETLAKNIAKRLLFAMFQNAFCYGQRSRAYLLRHGVAPDRIHIRRQAAALPATYDPTTIPRLRKAAIAASVAPRFLYVGRLSEEKRIDVLLRAFATIRPENPTAKLRIVGDGPEKMALRALAAELQLADSVDFAGARSEQALFDEYLAATALVLPSWSEPWGLVVNEALHYGCPVIVSHRCGCVPELVETSRCGLVFECADVADLADKLTQALSAYRDAEATAIHCLERIGEYSPRAAAEGLADGALKIVGGRSPSARPRPSIKRRAPNRKSSSAG